MLPGKRYTVDDIFEIIIRRGWLILVTMALAAIAAVAVSKRLPNRYRSETLIMLVPQGVPDTYVKAAVTGKIEDRLATLQDQILSRSRIERIIMDLDLYGPLRRTLPMEDVVQHMRDDIAIKVEGKESFRVSYVGVEARTVQKATERLASLFIEENLRDRENTAENTNQFLDSQLEDAKHRLIDHEKKLEEYRNRYGGELPSQTTANLQAIQNAQVQLQTLAEATDRARERRLLLERQIADLQSDPMLMATAAPTPAAPQDGSSLTDPTAQQLEVARARLQMLLTRAKPDHPDVRSMQRTIRDLEAKLQAEKQPSGTAPSADKPLSPAERLRQQRIKEAKLQIDDIDRQLTEKQEQDRGLRAVVAQYQAKLDAVPKRESELVELTRDYSTLQTTYQSLLAKREDAKLAANLERRNIGAQFKVLDPARVPETPFSPNRLQIDLGGVAAGFALGVLIIVLLEARHSAFSSEEEIVRLLNLPVLALIPTMADSDHGVRRRHWKLRS
jgi:polysaccharide chain length determinant protein (PEP-CTERM system associated)